MGLRSSSDEVNLKSIPENTVPAHQRSGTTAATLFGRFSQMLKRVSEYTEALMIAAALNNPERVRARARTTLSYFYLFISYYIMSLLIDCCVLFIIIIVGYYFC